MQFTADSWITAPHWPPGWAERKRKTLYEHLIPGRRGKGCWGGNTNDLCHRDREMETIAIIIANIYRGLTSTGLHFALQVLKQFWQQCYAQVVSTVLTLKKKKFRLISFLKFTQPQSGRTRNQTQASSHKVHARKHSLCKNGWERPERGWLNRQPCSWHPVPSYSPDPQ